MKCPWGQVCQISVTRGPVCQCNSQCPAEVNNNHANTSQTPSKHLANTSQTPRKHLANTSQTPRKHLSNTSQTPLKHLANTSPTPHNTTQIPLNDHMNSLQSYIVKLPLSPASSDMCSRRQVLLQPMPLRG